MYMFHRREDDSMTIDLALFVLRNWRRLGMKLKT